jgi:dihydrofolate reductase
VEVARSVEEAIERAGRHGDRVFCAGGATLYAQCLPHATAMYLSFIKEDHDGDTRFPEFDPETWTVARVEDHPDWEFRVYVRAGSPSHDGAPRFD